MSKLFNFYLLFEKDEKKKFLSIFFIIFAISLVDVLSVGATIPFLLALTHTTESSNYVVDFLIQNPIFSTSENLILHTFFIVLFFFILKTIFVFYLIYYKNNIFRFFFISLSNRIMRSYMFAPYEKFIEINSSKMINSLNKEIELLINGAINPFIILILEAITIFFILCFAAYLNIFLFLILTFFVIFLIFFFKISFGSKLKSLGIERLNNQQLVQQNLIQGFHGIKDIKLLNKENFFIRKFSEKIEKIGKLTMLYNFFSEIPRYLIELFVVILLGIFIFYFLLSNTTSILIFLGIFGVIAIKLLPSLNRISISINSIKYYSPVAIGLLNDLKLGCKDNKDKEYENLIKIDFYKFEAKNIEFFYKNNQKIFSDLNFVIKKYDYVGIFGESGAGKTTFIDLFTGLINVNSGKIIINEILNLEDIKKSWQNIIGYVPQFSYFTEESIYNNIAFGIDDKKINYQLVEELVVLVGLNSFVKNLPQGCNTKIIDRGLNLSGGQKQKIAIARALYKDPQILIFDEATNSLDNLAEQEIVTLINEIKKNKTIIHISHNLSLFKNCSKILEVKERKIDNIGISVIK